MLGKRFITKFFSVKVRDSRAVMKHHDQSNLGRKEFISLTVPYNSSSPEAVRTGTEAGQEVGGRS